MPQSRRRPPRRPAGRRPTRPTRAPSAPPSATRERVAARSRRPLVMLSALPKAYIVVAILALLLLGLFAHGWLGAVPLLLLAAFVGWLVYLSWPAVAPRGRSGRLVLLVLLLAAGVYKAVVG